MEEKGHLLQTVDDMNVQLSSAREHGSSADATVTTLNTALAGAESKVRDLEALAASQASQVTFSPTSRLSFDAPNPTLQLASIGETLSATKSDNVALHVELEELKALRTTLSELKNQLASANDQNDALQKLLDERKAEAQVGSAKVNEVAHHQLCPRC